MREVFLIAEGDTDIALLKKLIPDRYTKDIRFIAGKGYSAATSLASSLLYNKSDSYVILVLDADTTDPTLVQERYDFLDWQLRRMSVDRSYKIFLFIPMIEALFINHGVVKRYGDNSFDPKSILADALNKKNISLNKFIENLSSYDLNKIRGDQTVQSIIKTVQQEPVQT